MFKKILAASILAVMSSYATASVHWGYEGEAAPENWGKLSSEYQLCEVGKNQSPINITDEYHTKIPDLKIHYKFAPADIVNNGHTVQINVEKQDDYITIDGKKYTLRQFHFHAPSENTIEGKSYPVEGHFVHTDENGNIAVLAVMFEVGKTNALLDEIWTSLSAKENDPVKLKSEIDVSKLMPKTQDYYRFSGSLTTPPCSEGVTWIVLKNPVQISEKQKERFEQAFKHHNNRPIQQKNGRVIITD